MKKIYTFALCAAAVLFASCEKEALTLTPAEETPSEVSEYTVLTAVAPETKTVLDGTAVKWTDGDQINVNGVASEALSLSAPSASATFKFTGVLDTPYKAVYPAGIYKDASTVTLPASQSYAEGTFAAGAAPMAAYNAAGTTLSFGHLVSVVKVTVERSSGSDADTHDILYVEFSGNAGEKVNGDFAIDYTTLSLAPATASSDAEKAVRVTETLSTAQTFYIAVPAREYASGFTIKVSDSKGHYMVKSTSSSRTLEAGHVHPMAAFAFVPTGTEIGTEIKSAADLIQFAADWAAGTLTEPVTATVVNDFSFSSGDVNNYTTVLGSTSAKAFTGILNGDGHTITLNGNTSGLIGYLGAGGEVKNLTLAGTANFTSGNLGTLINNVQSGASVVSCSSSATVNLTGAPTTELRLGGLIGENSGSVTNGDFSGVISAASTFSTTGALRLGGVCGYNSGSIVESDMAGAIQFLGKSTATVFVVGGVCGANTKSVYNCTTSKNTTYETETSGSATILINNTGLTSTWVRIGGIIGHNADDSASAEKCKNYGGVYVFVPAGSKSGSNNPQGFYGGVVGDFEKGTVSDCTNYGTVTGASCKTDEFIGGVAGRCGNGSTPYLTDCENNGSVIISKYSGTESAQKSYVGGIVGGNYSPNLDKLTNNGKVTVSAIRNGTSNSSRTYAGGVIGLNSGVKINGTGTSGTEKQIRNTGDILYNRSGNIETATTARAFGGVVGLSNANLSGLYNSGKVEFSPEGSGAISGQPINVGGVLGRASATITLSQCENAGDLSANVSNYTSSVGIYVGGIYGLKPAANTVTTTDCTNTGTITGGNLASGSTVTSVTTNAVGNSL